MPKNVLLINPSLINASIGHYSRTVEKNRGIYPPLGLAYVASALRDRGHEVTIVDCDIDPKIPLKDYDWVGFYVMTWTYRQAVEMLKIIKINHPNIKSILGGPHATCMGDPLGMFDFVVPGEGEEAIVEVVETSSVSKKALLSDLNRVSFPAWDLLQVDKYRDIFTRHKRFATMIASRGCPFNCVFCDRKNRMGNKWRVRSVDNVIKEIRLLKYAFGVKEIMFYDDNFVFYKDWINDFCLTLIKSKLDIAWECRTRVDTVDPDILWLMKSAGCYRIRYGMESGNDRILKSLKKGITVEQIKDCVKMTRKAGIEIFAYFMMGSPYETKKEWQDTLDLALWVNAEFTVISKTILIVGSELFDWAVENKRIAPDYWDKFAKFGGDPAPALFGKGLDDFINYSYHRLYCRPKQLWALTKLAYRNLCKSL